MSTPDLLLERRDDGWRERVPLLYLRQNLAVVAQFEPDWGAAETVRTVLAPFRRSTVRRT
ncbi:hypothetical protein [Cellulomonas sp. URHB0016]